MVLMYEWCKQGLQKVPRLEAKQREASTDGMRGSPGPQDILSPFVSSSGRFGCLPGLEDSTLLFSCIHIHLSRVGGP